MARRWRPPESERAIGLGFYVTSTAPVGGTIKASEIPSYPRPDPAGAFTVLRVRSQNWEQHELAERLGAAIGLPPHALAWAGTKDRRAVADRLLSYRGDPPTAAIELPGVEVLEAYRARDGLSLGHHYGNTFRIRVSQIEPPEEGRRRLGLALDELRTGGAVPNLFGPQRFGEVRPITHLVGRELVRGDPAAAVEVYLAGLPELSGPEGEAARREYATTHDPRAALAQFPRAYGFERSILERLARGASPSAALRAFSRELRLLFVHAVQSWMFNLWLSERVEAGLSLTVPEAGDTVLRVAADGTTPSRDAVPVTGDNLLEVRDTVGRGRARRAGPVLGYSTPRPEGPVGALTDRVLSTTGVSLDGFRMPTFPEIASSGAWRPTTLPTPLVGVRPDGYDAAVLDFALPKGAYATVLLRELLKPGATEVEAPSDA
jgi:tRNA pseudouridine13 synthase